MDFVNNIPFFLFNSYKIRSIYRVKNIEKGCFNHMLLYIKYFIEHGAEVNKGNPIIFQAFRKNKEFIQYLK